MTAVRPRRLRVAVGIATKRRPAVLQAMLADLMRQSEPADHVFIAAPTVADVGSLDLLRLPHKLVLGRTGLTAQRNALLDVAASFDVLVFFDDDFFPAPAYLAQVRTLFTTHDDVCLATGHVVADGIGGPGLSVEEAHVLLADDEAVARPPEAPEPIYNVYGCNFAIRMRGVRASGAVFDEALPLYGWLEDVDFSRRMAFYGRIVRAPSLRGVHLGVKSGRQPGIMLGYSQVANPLHLVRNGTLSFRRAIAQMLRNIGMNLVLSIQPEAHVDRRGRLKGNAKALSDLLIGRLHPKRILSI